MRFQVDVAGSKIAVSFRPSVPTVYTPSPPAVMMRPSGRWALPEQKMLPGALRVVGNVCEVAFQTAVGSGCCQPSQMSRLPDFRRIECTATIGQFMRADHCPVGESAGVTALDAADAGPVPIAFVALTVNV
jgi:hypothetical protein